MRVTPRAKRSGIEGVRVLADGTSVLAVRLAVPPVEGAANRRLVALLAKALAVPRSAVSVIAGEKARLKTVRIDGVSVEAVAALHP